MAGTDDEHPDEAAECQRLDKWLWFARFTKSRTAAAQLIEAGKVRVNRLRASKPSHTVRRGDVLTILAHAEVRVVKVLAAGVRRGPTREARQLYEGLAPSRSGNEDQVLPAAGQVGGGARPTKRDRRLLRRFTGGKP